MLDLEALDRSQLMALAAQKNIQTYPTIGSGRLRELLAPVISDGDEAPTKKADELSVPMIHRILDGSLFPYNYNLDLEEGFEIVDAPLAAAMAGKVPRGARFPVNKKLNLLATIERVDTARGLMGIAKDMGIPFDRTWERGKMIVQIKAWREASRAGTVELVEEAV
jgi:hypothetical protein